MEFKRVRDESTQCVKFEMIELLTNSINTDRVSFVVLTNNTLYDIEHVSTTNTAAIFHIGCEVGAAINGEAVLHTEYNNFIRPKKIVENVVKNGKSVYVANGADIYEAIDITYTDTLILLYIGNIVGKFVYDSTDLKKLQESKKSGDSWFNYN